VLRSYKLDLPKIFETDGCLLVVGFVGLGFVVCVVCCLCCFVFSVPGLSF